VSFPRDAPWNYDENREPVDKDTRQTWREWKEYIEMVTRFVAAEGVDNKLSSTLNDQNFQILAYAMKVYLDLRRLGFYHRVIEPFEMKNVQYKAVESYLFAFHCNSPIEQLFPPQNMPYTGQYLPRCFQRSCLLGPPSMAKSVMLFSEISR
jgi:hypothetical protein